MVNRRDQLNVPLDFDLKEKWKRWAAMRGTTLSALVEALALACIEGRPLELPGGEVYSSQGDGLEELKKSILDQLPDLIAGEVSRAIADLAPPENFSNISHVGDLPTGADPELGNTTYGSELAPPENFSNYPDQDILPTGADPELGNEEHVPHWLIPNKEYLQRDFATAIGCDSATITKVFKGEIKSSRKADLNNLLRLKENGKLTQTEGGKWIYKP